jgi:hypothetical protein
VLYCTKRGNENVDRCVIFRKSLESVFTHFGVKGEEVQARFPSVRGPAQSVACRAEDTANLT